MNRNRTHSITIMALGCAIMCILGPLCIYIGIIPISLASLGVMLVSGVLGQKKGAAACLVYIILGTVGIPVFAGFQAGPGVLLGPTGGYIIGYFALSAASGIGFERGGIYKVILIPGTVLMYICGCVWLMRVNAISIIQAISVGVLPFIVPDMIKIIICLFVVPRIRKRIL